ncbi:MAG: tRNA lysidine(34) synthetase TilS [Pseudochelatococcus sp.]|jgi:tRNA(Ile)-lysidine synthase|uniref:tRNA lysidine(34) synthetase TilS n=1 Tax=Pseudochelatococcus sp. TaxID=2020869 RepID=UPI003D8EC33A
MIEADISFADRVLSARGPFEAVSDAEIATLFAPLLPAQGLVLAVSGGPDSLALLLLAARWRALAKNPAMSVVTVDHALRPAAAAEAHTVTRLAQAFGFSARIMVWRGEKPARAIQEEARAARYRLLAEAAREAGASHIVTAHHADDQAETVLMRLAAGSGIGGLAAMRPFRPLAAGDEGNAAPLTLARPLLAVTKARLESVVREAGCAAVDDPSNRDPRYTRARLRLLTPQRQALGLTPERLATLARRCARAENALDTVAERKFAQLARPDEDGLLIAADLWREPEEIVLRCVALGVERVCAGQDLPALRLERLESLVNALHAALRADTGLRRTLRGAVVGIRRGGELDIRREPKRRRGVVVQGR